LGKESLVKKRSNLSGNPKLVCRHQMRVPRGCAYRREPMNKVRIVLE